MDHGFLVHHDLVTAPASRPSRLALVLHGILGSGSNWRGFARRLAAEQPSWGFVLVDLRAHGRSSAGPPPHDVTSAAADLIALERALPLPVRGALGHSFGGKVALSFAAQRRGEPLDQVWVLDSQPGGRKDELSSARTAAVVRMLEQMPELLPSRERFVEIVEEQGHDRTFAAWLAMNLRRAEGGGYELRVDMTAIRALFESYYDTDLWSVIGDASRARRMDLVIGEKSEVVREADRARLAEIAAREPSVHVHVLPGAGHWVHVDDPEGLFRIVRDGLCSQAPTE